MKICFKKKAPPRMYNFLLIIKRIFFNISLFVSLFSFAIAYISGGIAEYFTYVAGLTFEEEPDYRHCKNILAAAIKAYGFEDDGILIYTSGDEKQNSRKVNLILPVYLLNKSV